MVVSNVLMVTFMLGNIHRSDQNFLQPNDLESTKSEKRTGKKRMVRTETG